MNNSSFHMVREFQLPAGALYLIPLANQGGARGRQGQRERERSAIGLLVRNYVGEDVRIGYRLNGRPYLIEDPRCISIAHTSGWGGLLVGDDPCGVDIEPVGRDASRVGLRIAADGELEQAKKRFPANPDLLVWCAKEAAYKAAAERREIDFSNDIKLISGENGRLVLSVASKTVEAGFFETEGLLVVFGKCDR